MKKGLTSLLLAVVILFGVVSGGAVTASAESAFDTSDACINLIKEEEGFIFKPYWDYAQYTVGYGTKCPDDKLEYYTEHGITEEEAVALLRSHLDGVENRLNKDLIDKFQLTLTQNQFDALVSFSYNCGTGWIYNESDNLRRAILTGATGNEIIYRFSRWCNAGGQIKTFLLRRRLCEANMYINGVYSLDAPENYGYVLYDANGGVADPNVQGFDANLTAAIIPTPTYEGYTFDGWYTERNGGTKVTVLDASVRNARLYAHWIDGAGNDPTQDESVEGVKITVTADDVNIRSGPGTSYSATSTAKKGDQFTITETATGSGYTWGKFYAGWIALKYTNYDQVAEKEEAPETPEVTPDAPASPETPEATAPVKGTVKVSDSLRIRTGPSTGYPVAGYLKNGDRVEILEQKIVGAMVWGRIEKGWISLDYVVLDPTDNNTETPTEPPVTEPPVTEPPVTEPPATEPPATEPPATEPPATEPPATEPPVTQPPVVEPTVWTGTVKVNDLLRVRSGPGTNYSIAGYLSPNAKVTVTERKTVGSTTWGKISNGWISLDYVLLDGASGTVSQSVMGTVNVKEFLRIRTGPSTSYAIAGYLGPKDRVEILERKTVNGVVWGRITKGWISLDYVILDNQSSDSGSSNAQPQTQTGKVTADCLRIRSAAGTGNKIVGYLYQGAKVTILETKTVNSVVWGRIEKGWISLDYVK